MKIFFSLKNLSLDINFAIENYKPIFFLNIWCFIWKMLKKSFLKVQFSSNKKLSIFPDICIKYPVIIIRFWGTPPPQKK